MSTRCCGSNGHSRPLSRKVKAVTFDPVTLRYDLRKRIFPNQQANLPERNLPESDSGACQRCLVTRGGTNTPPGRFRAVRSTRLAEGLSFIRATFVLKLGGVTYRHRSLQNKREILMSESRTTLTC